MKRGQEVYFISKGVVRRGIIYKQNMNTVDVLYEKGNYKRMYTFKRIELAVEIERGIDVGKRFGVCSNGKGDNGRNGKSCNVRNVGKSNRVSEKTSHNVLKGVWSLSGMA